MRTFCPDGELVEMDVATFALDFQGEEVGKMQFAIPAAGQARFLHLILQERFRNQAGSGKNFNVAGKCLAEAEKFLRSRGIKDIEAWFYKPDTLYFLEKHGYCVAPVADQQYVSERLKRLESVKDYLDFKPREKERHGNLMLRKRL